MYTRRAVKTALNSLQLGLTLQDYFLHQKAILSQACLGGAVGSVAVRAAWLR